MELGLQNTPAEISSTLELLDRTSTALRRSVVVDVYLANRFASLLEVHTKHLRSHAGQLLWDQAGMQMGLFGNGQGDVLGPTAEMSLNSLFDWFESSLAPLDLEGFTGRV